MAAANDDRTRLRPPVSRLRLLVSDVSMLGFTCGNGGLHRLKDVSVDRGGQAGLSSHTSGIARWTADAQIGRFIRQRYSRLVTFDGRNRPLVQ
jgi:hypothetical protein